MNTEVIITEFIVEVRESFMEDDWTQHYENHFRITFKCVNCGSTHTTNFDVQDYDIEEWETWVEHLILNDYGYLQLT